MAHLVRISFILSIIWQIVGCNSSEKKVSELSEIKFDYGNQYDLQSFLSDSIPGPNYEDCTPTWGIFYFRVNSKGEVDKVETRSTLRKSVSDKIIHNIYQTNGFWKIPNDKTPEIHKWFIYQYFDLGGKFCQDDNCTAQEKELQASMRSLSSALSVTQNHISTDNAEVLHVKIRGGGNIEM